MQAPMTAQPRPDWLERASRAHICPLCAAARQFETDYLHALCARLVDRSDDEPWVEVVRDLCAEHTTAFARASREAGVSANFALAAHLARLEQLADELSRLDRDGWLTQPECALCLARNELALFCVHRLLEGLTRADGRAIEQLLRAGGLCAAHFSMSWESGAGDEDREVLRGVQLDAVQRLADTVRPMVVGGEVDDHRAGAVAARAAAITVT
jgi:hypothetical protein